MNKKEFLRSLTEEQLGFLDSITRTNIIDELNRRKSETNLKIKIGDCLIDKDNCGAITLIKILSSDGDNWFDCGEISIDNYNISNYGTIYHIADLSDYESIDSSIYEQALALIKSKENALEKVIEQFDNQIRKICSTLLNTQNKN